MKATRCFGHRVLVALFTLSILLSGAVPIYAADYTGKTVTAVDVSGNVTVPTSTIMAVVKVKPGDKCDNAKTQQDMRAIFGLGSFFDVVTNYSEVPEGIKITYTVNENPSVKTVIIQGNTKVTSAKIKSLLPVNDGLALNTAILQDGTTAVEKYYHDQGFVLAKVSNVDMSPAGVLTITINEGVIEGIIVKGNDKTKPNVITRELKQKPGDVFNTNDAQRSIQRLSNLGFFEDVSMKLNPGREPNGVVLETDVKEQKTGSFSIGAGYSADNGLVGILGIGDKNFHGTGDAINIETQLGGNTNSAGFTFSYVIPWLDSKHTSLSFSLFDAETQYTDYGLPNQPDNTQRSTYDRRSEGVAVSLGRPEGEYVTNYFNLRSQSDKYISYVSGPVQYDAAPGSLLYNSAFNAQYLANNFGVTNSVGVGRVFDNRDNVFNPTKGNRFEVGCEFAGRVFGSNFSYNKYVLDERQYFDLGKEHVLALRVQGGYATGNMPQSGLFVVGGADTLRGYEDYEFSGTRMVTATAEYRFPIIQKVEGVLFTDMGNAWDNGWSNTPGMHSSVGVGLRMNSPLGPIRVDLGKGSEGTRGDFSFGGQF